MTQPPLTVSEQILSTASIQADAATKIETAKSATHGTAGHVFQTHGLVCSPTAMALKSAELSRRNAAEKMHLISTDLSVKLTSAATEYDGTDQQEAGKLNGQMQPD
ncbi:ESX-1 secretion-associated protein [Mycolicibacterium sp. XJ870]